ncbi:Hypothetical protein CpOVID04_0768 [Corynebacterium pseudotuberculosis]|nr:Hypothetical protein CpN1_0742 [Corynebacterium pseudotuberculosis]QBI72683.1 Hypothetical protein Cp38MAT_0764 [Corynebacterium pseudotuberculosis]QBK60197.1 Hypothetical protein CpE7_0766 [Corynebacterium pseudotuberculosis]QBS29055.1 Hypothetical protein CpCAP1C_0765 [Corynebacterium pseudotuberculosis]QDL40617.1 Hypothetical protein CpOVID04_0768 [Corynebacterium pseudotuberculosis]
MHKRLRKDQERGKKSMRSDFPILCVLPFSFYLLVLGVTGPVIGIVLTSIWKERKM